MKKRNIMVAAGLGFAQLAFVHVQVHAQTQDTTNLNEVVITASRSPKKVGDIGKIVKVISKEEIAKSQGRTLPELLNTVAGISIAGSGSSPGEVQSVYLRGASSANTLILINGISVNDASGISGEYNIAAIDISQIERIEILKGASSTLYGSDAVAGVINIITKKGEGKLAANALLSTGSFGTYKEAIGLNGQIEKTNVSLNFSNLSSKGFSTATGAGFDKDDFKQMALGLNLSNNISKNITLNGGFQANQNKAGLDAGAFTDATNYNYDKTALLAHLGTKISLAKGDLSFILSQNNVENVFDNNGSVTDNKGNISNMESVLSYQLANYLDITSGANYKYSKTDQINPYSSPLSKANHITSLYTSFFIKAADVFRMEIGGRYNNHSQYGDNFTYTLNPSVLVANQLKFYVNVSSAYRVPSLYQLNSEYGNLNLKPETSQNYETGLESNFLDNKLFVTASVYQRKIKDVIDFGEITPGNYGYINQNKQNDKGLELEASFKPNQKLNFNVFYAFVDGKVQLSDSAPETFNLFRRPKNSYGANLGYTFTKKFYASLNYKWNDSRIDQYYDNSNFTLVSTQLNSFSKLDAYLQYKPSKSLTLFTDVKNILDANYNDFAGYNTKGINFNAGISFNFN
jgi:vitamin B12 transporter